MSDRDAECRLYERLAAAVLRRQIRVEAMEPGAGGEVKSTADGRILVSFDPPAARRLSPELAGLYRMGVFAEELLRLKCTDRTAQKLMLSLVRESAERRIIRFFAGQIEAAALARMAPVTFGGTLLSAYRYARSRKFLNRPPLKDAGSPFRQLAEAAAQYGWQGVTRGFFTRKEAAAMFGRLKPEFDSLCTESDTAERMRAAVRWTEMTRPLWQPEAESEELSALLEELTEPEPEFDAEDGSRTDRKGSKAADIRMKDGETGSGDPSGEQSPNKDDSAAEDAPGTEAGSPGTESDRGEENPEDLSGGVCRTEEEADRLAEESVKITPALMKSLLRDREAAGQTDGSGAAVSTAENIDFAVDPARYGVVRCRNEVKIPSADDESGYRRMKEACAPDIRTLTAALRRILMQDNGLVLRGTSGKYNLKRAVRRTTVRVFDRKKQPKNAPDLAVMILVDESGSMKGEKIRLAAETALAAAESLAELSVPCYVLGFTADTGGADILHHHYIRWRNTLRERMSLAGIRAGENNCDGYSIRYAGRLLAKRPAEHRLCLIISDGLPACRLYAEDRNGLSSGFADTASAIGELRQIAEVGGIGIGSDREILKKLYRGNFIQVRDIRELPAVFADRLRRMLGRL